MEFSGFWEAKVVIFDHFGSPGALFGGSGPNFKDFLIFRDFGSAPPRKGSPILRKKHSHNPLLGVLDFGCVFEDSFYQFFWILGGRRLHFRHHFGTFWEAPASPESKT